MSKVVIGSYFPINSEIHDVHPIIKLLCLLGYILILFFVNSLIPLMVLMLLLILILILSNVPFRLYLKVINSLKILFGFIIIVNLIIKGSLMLSVIAILKIILGVLYAIVFISTTTFNDIMKSLLYLFRPFKKIGIPVSQMVLSISLAFNFIPIIFHQANKILKSQASRGIDFYNSSIKNKIIAITSIISPMFLLSLRRADAIADYMELKLYNIDVIANSKIFNKIKMFDVLFLMIHIIIIIILVKG